MHSEILPSVWENISEDPFIVTNQQQTEELVEGREVAGQKDLAAAEELAKERELADD